MTGHHHQNFKTFSSTQQKNEIAPPYLLHHHSSSPSECLHVHGHASWKWKWLSKLLPQTDILTNPRHDRCVANLGVEESHASAAWLCTGVIMSRARGERGRVRGTCIMHNAHFRIISLDNSKQQCIATSLAFTYLMYVYIEFGVTTKWPNWH